MFLASITFWAGLAWALKMPIGHIVDLMWRWKEVLVYFVAIGGVALVALLNIVMFANVHEMSTATKVSIYGEIYLLALLIPIVSDVGVTLGSLLRRRRARAMQRADLDEWQIQKLLFEPVQAARPNWWILGGSAFFVAFSPMNGAVWPQIFSRSDFFSVRWGLLLS